MRTGLISVLSAAVLSSCFLSFSVPTAPTLAAEPIPVAGSNDFSYNGTYLELTNLKMKSAFGGESFRGCVEARSAKLTDGPNGTKKTKLLWNQEESVSFGNNFGAFCNYDYNSSSYLTITPNWQNSKMKPGESALVASVYYKRNSLGFGENTLELTGQSNIYLSGENGPNATMKFLIAANREDLTLEETSSNTYETSNGVPYVMETSGFRGIAGGASAQCPQNDPGMNSSTIKKATLKLDGGSDIKVCVYAVARPLYEITFEKEVVKDNTSVAAVPKHGWGGFPTFSYRMNVADPAWQKDYPNGISLTTESNPNTLTPTGWGEAGLASLKDKPLTTYSYPVAHTFTEDSVTPSVGEKQSGWRMASAACYQGKSGTQAPLTQNIGVDTANRSITFTQGFPEEVYRPEDLKIRCRWVSEYIGRSSLTLKKTFETPPPAGSAVNEQSWILSATPSQPVKDELYPYTEVTGKSGDGLVTDRWTRSGTYILDEKPVDAAQSAGYDLKEWSCHARVGDAPSLVKGEDGTWTVTIKPDSQVECAATAKASTSSFAIEIKTAGRTDAVTNANKTFSGTYTCGATTGTWKTTADAPKRVVIGSIPVNTTCVVVADTPSGDLSRVDQYWEAPAVSPQNGVKIAAGTTPVVTVTHTVAALDAPSPSDILPATGGRGVTIFCLMGGLLAAIAVGIAVRHDIRAKQS